MSHWQIWPQIIQKNQFIFLDLDNQIIIKIKNVKSEFINVIYLKNESIVLLLLLFISKITSDLTKTKKINCININIKYKRFCLYNSDIFKYKIQMVFSIKLIKINFILLT